MAPGIRAWFLWVHSVEFLKEQRVKDVVGWDPALPPSTIPLPLNEIFQFTSSMMGIKDGLNDVSRLTIYTEGFGRRGGWNVRG